MIARRIPMSAPMVRALLAGTKTQTRRICKPQPNSVGDEFSTRQHNALMIRGPNDEGCEPVPCPYGKPGDLLYIKEAWRAPASLDELSGAQIAEKCLNAGYNTPWCPIQFEADGERLNRWSDFGSAPGSEKPGRYRHARFMPRWASRLTLKLTEVRVERLQEISEADAIAEGVSYSYPEEDQPREAGGTPLRPARNAYRQLWEQINGPGSWARNPWVWALTLTVEKRKVQQTLNQSDYMREKCTNYDPSVHGSAPTGER